MLFIESHLSWYLKFEKRSRVDVALAHKRNKKTQRKGKTTHPENNKTETNSGGRQGWSLRKTPNLPSQHGFLLLIIVSLNTIEAMAIQKGSMCISRLDQSHLYLMLFLSLDLDS